MEETHPGDWLEQDEVRGIGRGPQEGEGEVDAEVMAEEVDVEVGERLGGAGDAVCEDEGRGEDGRDADDVDEDVLRVGVVRGLRARSRGVSCLQASLVGRCGPPRGAAGDRRQLALPPSSSCTLVFACTSSEYRPRLGARQPAGLGDLRCRWKSGEAVAGDEVGEEVARDRGGEGAGSRRS